MFRSMEVIWGEIYFVLLYLNNMTLCLKDNLKSILTMESWAVFSFKHEQTSQNNYVFSRFLLLECSFSFLQYCTYFNIVFSTF